MSALVEIKNLTKSYRKGGWFAKAQEKTILRKVTISLREHEILGLVLSVGRQIVFAAILNSAPAASGLFS